MHFRTTSFLQFPSVFTPLVKVTLTTITMVFPILFHWNLLSLTSTSYFLILLDSVSSSTFFNEKLLACYISEIAMHCF